jgi:hypothetical protein
MHYTRWYRGEKLHAVLSRQQAPPLALPSSEADLGYLAGLLDGEGSISLRSYGQYWRVRVNKMDKEIIDWLATIGRTTSRQAQGGNRKDMWEWSLADQEDVSDLLSAVLPYLKIRTQRDKALRTVANISTRGAPPLRPERGRTMQRPET